MVGRGEVLPGGVDLQQTARKQSGQDETLTTTPPCRIPLLQEDINEEPRPRMWWPKDIWGKYAGALEEFKQPEAAGKAVQCLNHMVRALGPAWPGRLPGEVQPLFQRATCHICRLVARFRSARRSGRAQLNKPPLAALPCR